MKVIPWPKVEPDQIVFRDMSTIQRWCRMPYIGHPKGCPNAEGCDLFIDDLWHQVWEAKALHLLWIEFDLDGWEKAMASRHPEWTSRQCRNLLYWQKTVRAELRQAAKDLFPEGQLIIGAEGGGVDYYLTMRRLGVPLDTIRNLHTVRVIGLIIENGRTQPNLDDYINGGD